MAEGLLEHLADRGYDSTANISAITARGGIPLIPLSPGDEKIPPGITHTLGTPLFPCGLPIL